MLDVKTAITPDNSVWSINWLARSDAAYLASGESANLSVFQLGTINIPHGCMITNNRISACNAFGFISRNGANNIFSSCNTQGIKTTSANAILDIQGWALATAGAFVLVGDEYNSHIVNCTAQETSAPIKKHNAAYGLWLTSGAATSPLELSLTTSTAISGDASTTAWLVKGATTYLALGGTNSTRIKIFKFDPTSPSPLDLVASSTAPDGSVSSIAWLSEGDSTYLAAGGAATTAPHDHELMVFKFDPLTATLELASVVRARWIKEDPVNSNTFISLLLGAAADTPPVAR